jgi:arylsulfate sulfotransferase
MKYCAAFPAALVLGVLAGCGGSGSSLPTTDFSSQIAGTNNPQVASYSITVPKQATVSIEYSRDTGYALKTWEVDTPEAGGKVSILVAGMLPNATYHMRAVVAYKDGTTVADTDHTFQAGGIPPQVTARFTATTTSGLDPQPGIEMVDGIGINIPTLVATDLKGNIIWTYPFKDAVVGAATFSQTQLQGFQQIANGDFVIVSGPLSSAVLGPVDPAIPNLIREIDLAGNTVKQLTITTLQSSLIQAGFTLVPLCFSHEIVVLPNGHWLLLVGVVRSVTLTGQTTPTAVLGDAIVDVDPNMKPVWVWDTFDHLDVNRHPYLFPDWTHANAIAYSPDDGNLLFSLRHQNWIIKIDYRDGGGQGDVLWHLGPGTDSDFTLQNADGTKDTSPEDWFYAQHYPYFFSSNTTGDFKLGIMDNGDDRVFADGTSCVVQGGAKCYTTIPVLEVNENDKTAKFLFHQILAPSQYSFFGGNTRLLDNGNVEYDLAGYFISGGTGVFEVTPQSSPQTVWKMTAPAPALSYRAYRAPSLYPGVQWTGLDF